MTYQSLCLHQRENETVLARWPVEPGRTDCLERVRCRECGREWIRHEDAGGEDV
jgi:hypothetical protein